MFKLRWCLSPPSYSALLLFLLKIIIFIYFLKRVRSHIYRSHARNSIDMPDPYIILLNG